METVVCIVRLCPVGLAFMLAVLCSSLQGCKPTRTPIFEWADPPAPVAGVSTPGQAGASGSTPVQSGRGAEVAGQAGGEMLGESGSGGDAQPVDPNARFEWKQTLPDTTCRAANFVGTFSCNVQNSLTNQRIDGTLLIDLVGPAEDQTLKAENSSLNLLTDPPNNLSLMTTVTGSASCMTLLFKGEVPPTAFTFDQVGIPFQLALGGFCGSGLMGGTVSGTLLGQLGPGGLGGQMALTIGACACEGAFNLRAQR